jgi:hypothetical protein
MADIKVYFKDGGVTSFPHEVRPGGSYCNRVRYEGQFVIVTDVWGHERAFPAAEVKEVNVDPGPQGGRW